MEDVKVTFEVVASSFFWHVTFQDLYENIERSDEGEVLMSKVVRSKAPIVKTLPNAQCS